jgi:metal-sulfur cluster biosynthetic enzyme
MAAAGTFVTAPPNARCGYWPWRVAASCLPGAPAMTTNVTEAAVTERLRQIDDPELGLNLVDLGLIYGIEIADGAVTIRMTLTTPGCPLHETILPAVEQLVGTLAGVRDVRVDLVWDPPWTPERLSPLGALALGWNRN